MQVPKGQRIFDAGAVFVGGDFIAVHDRFGGGVGLDVEHLGDGVDLPAQLGAIGDFHQTHGLAGGDLHSFFSAVNEQSESVDDRLHIRSEEHTSELQSQSNLVCRLLLEKKKNKL